ncbi:MAG: beta-N-acetylhexosaminidase [Acetobacteraceae bacterium]|nr:beta-N-acetylhexosaminidase [Acetobacteraceae bacterium]
MPLAPAACILGVSGPRLTPDEVALFRRRPPAGAILFARNVQDPAQLLALTAELRDLLGEAAPILIDQEGGRVARLRPPHWPSFPPAAQFEGGPEAAARANARAIGDICRAMGLDVVCAPCLDLRVEGAHAIIGDRGFSADPAEIARLGSAWAEGLREADCTPVMKHIPGHGRALLDSHEALPRVTATEEDLAPFRALAGRNLWAMTAHILYPEWDAARPATISPSIIARIIRGEIGHDGVLISDDLAMKALCGRPDDLARAVLEAGCDLALHCPGVFEENAAILDSCPPLAAAALERLASTGHGWG